MDSIDRGRIGPGKAGRMHAIAFYEFGEPEVLRVVDVPIPEPTGAQVRIAVRAAGVNPADWKIRSGALVFGEPSFPQFPGAEVAGVVDAVGPEAAGVAVGDEVIAWTRGGYAEYALSAEVAAKPEELAWADAAALPVAVSTAAKVLALLRPRAGETLLVNGASGAVGSMAVQLARAEGVTVIGTAAPANQDLVRALGATPTPYGDGLVERVRALAPDGVDAVFDAAGHGVLPAAIELRGGTDRIVTIADGAAVDLGIEFSTGPGPRSTDLLGDVAQRLARGEFRLPGTARAFPLAEAAAAQREMEHGRRPGKVVLIVG